MLYGRHKRADINKESYLRYISRFITRVIYKGAAMRYSTLKTAERRKEQE